MTNNDVERDELRARFTIWLKTLIYRAKIDYCRRNHNDIEIISIDDLSDECLAVEDPMEINSDRTREFEFEEARLATAFAELPLRRRQILNMLFVHQMEPQEIANSLHCTVQHVYNQRSKALKTLRDKLTKEGK